MVLPIGMIYCRFPFVYHQHQLLKQKQQEQHQEQKKQQKQPQLLKQQIILLKQQEQENLKQQQQQENGWRKSYNIKCWWYKVSYQISYLFPSHISFTNELSYIHSKHMNNNNNIQSYKQTHSYIYNLLTTNTKNIIFHMEMPNFKIFCKIYFNNSP